MKRNDFYKRIAELFEIEEESINEETPVKIDSLSLLALIVLIDENFNKQVNAGQLKNVETIGALMNIIGRDNFEGF